VFIVNDLDIRVDSRLLERFLPKVVATKKALHIHLENLQSSEPLIVIIRALISVDNLRYGAYGDLALFSLFSVEYILEPTLSDYIIVANNPMYEALRLGVIELIKVYSLAGFKLGELEKSVKLEPYAIAITVLSEHFLVVTPRATMNKAYKYQLVIHSPLTHHHLLNFGGTCE